MLTAELMQRMWPRGNSKISGLIEGIVAAAPMVFPKYGLTSALTVAHAMAQFSHECGAGTEMVENIHYSAARAVQVWPKRFISESDVYRKVGSFAGDADFAVKLIDNVYGTRMGNRPGTHDGSTFIGRGLSQVTGREGYEKLSAKIGLDLIENPGLVSAPPTALECGVADFVLCGCLSFALADNIDMVTLRLNGGHIGLDERKTWLTKWKAALASEPAMIQQAEQAPADDGSRAQIAQAQAALTAHGFDPGVADGIFGAKTEAATKAFQAANGLPETGEIDAATWAALTAA